MWPVERLLFTGVKEGKMCGVCVDWQYYLKVRPNELISPATMERQRNCQLHFMRCFLLELLITLTVFAFIALDTHKLMCRNLLLWLQSLGFDFFRCLQHDRNARELEY